LPPRCISIACTFCRCRTGTGRFGRASCGTRLSPPNWARGFLPPLLPLKLRKALRAARSLPAVRQLLQLADPLFHFPTWLEGYDQSGENLHFLAGAGVACRPGLAFLDLEDPEIAEFDPPFSHQRLRDAVKDPLHDLLGLGLEDAHFFGNRLGHLFLGHEPPSLASRNVPAAPRSPGVRARHDLLL